MRILEPIAPPLRRWLPRLTAMVLILSCGTSRASLVLSLQSVSANAGTSGNTLDVFLTNTGPSAVTVGGFSFEISSPTPNIVFPSANTSSVVAPYVFNGDSFDTINGFPITTATGQTLDASDFSNSGNGTVVGLGATFGLGHLSFNVAGGTAPGPYTISFGPNTAATSVSDALGNTIAFTTNSGTITVNGGGGASVPESSPLVLAGVPVLMGLAYRWVRRRKG